MAHALARALAPQRDDHALVRGLQRVDVPCQGVEHIGIRLGALGGEIVSLPGADIDCRLPAFRHGERRHLRQRHVVEPLLPFLLGQIEPIRRQRLVRRAGFVERLAARFVIVGDLREALMRGFFGQRLEHDRRFRQIVEQRVELVVEQRQPMLHAGITAAFAHRFVELIVARSPRRRPRHSRCGICGWCRS